MKLERHYLSAILPDIPADEYGELVASIKKYGQKHPIVGAIVGSD